MVFTQVLARPARTFPTQYPPTFHQKNQKNIHPPTKNRQYKKIIDIKFKKYKKFKLFNRKKKENITNCRIIITKIKRKERCV